MLTIITTIGLLRVLQYKIYGPLESLVKNVSKKLNAKGNQIFSRGLNSGYSSLLDIYQINTLMVYAITRK